MWLLNSSVVADPVVSNQRCFGKLSQTYIVHKTDKHTMFLEVRIIVFNATFNNISVISWQSVLLVEETRIS